MNLKFKELVKLYKEYSVILGKGVIYKNIEYIADDITENGHLVLINNNEKITISSNEIAVKGSFRLNK